MQYVKKYTKMSEIYRKSLEILRKIMKYLIRNSLLIDELFHFNLTGKDMQKVKKYRKK
jgi:hypothetical protein